MFIKPTVKIHPSISAAAEEYEKYGQPYVHYDEESVSISEIANGSRVVITGEPGVGKTELLNQVHDHLKTQGFATECIGLRTDSLDEKIDKFTKLKTDKKKVLLLDALDEVRSVDFRKVLNQIDETAQNFPDISIFLTSRWVFINKYRDSFANYKTISVLPFQYEQVCEYLSHNGFSKEDADVLVGRVMQFNHSKQVIFIPRYLSYFCEFAKENNTDDVSSISRTDLFEYFINSKLKLDDEKLGSEKSSIVRRILEKLALTMEILNTNTISKDNLMTFFDEIDSDLKIAFLSQVSIEDFYEKYIVQPRVVRVSHEDADSIEFQNAEFQEYLAAKEITRFINPETASFSFSVDSEIQEIYPSWLNTLTFLTDIQPDLADKLIDFYEIGNQNFKVIDESFFSFISRINPKVVSKDKRIELFFNILSYHQNVRQWISGPVADVLGNFYDPSSEGELKKLVAIYKKRTGSARYVPLGNLTAVVGRLIEEGFQCDKKFWIEELITFAGDDNKNGVLQRRALSSLSRIGDKVAISKLPDLTSHEDDLVRDAFLETIASLDPNKIRSVNFFIEAIKADNFHGRHSLYKVTQKKPLKHFFEMYCKDDQLQEEFLEDTRIYGKQDQKIIKNVEKVYDKEMESLLRKALIASVESRFFYSASDSKFIRGIFDLVSRDKKHFVIDFLTEVKDSTEGGKSGFYFLHEFLYQLIKKEDVKKLVAFLKKYDEERYAMNVLMRIKGMGTKDALAIYEEGRKYLPDLYKEWETAQKNSSKQISHEVKRNKETLREFRVQLKPAPNKYSTNVFRFYRHNHDVLDGLMSQKNKDRFIELIEGSVLKFDPLEGDFTITQKTNDSSTYTMSGIAAMFGDALYSADHLNIDVKKFRDNIIKYIPYAHSEELEIIFKHFGSMTEAEVSPVIDIYKSKTNDLWQHLPESFVNSAKKYSIVSADSVLREFVHESSFRSYIRNDALRVSYMLNKDPNFLWSIFNLYIGSVNEEDKSLAYEANALLISGANDRGAIEWRIKEIKNRTVPFSEPRGRGVHNVGAIEDELKHDKKFARPLIDLNKTGFEDLYLNLLEFSADVWNKGTKYQAYAGYIWDIVIGHFKNLSSRGSYKPLIDLEKKVSELGSREGMNWFASRVAELRKEYLMTVGRPKNISEAIRKYNDVKNESVIGVIDIDDLFNQVLDVINTDLRFWVEDEGAYSFIVGERVFDSKKQNYETFIQKTIKSHLQLCLVKKGLEVTLDREPQQLDDTRVDFLIRYGFVGPIAVETKLTTNTDLKKKDLKSSKSFKNMQKYMRGYGSKKGIFLVFNDKTTAKEKLTSIEKCYGEIEGVSPVIIDCAKFLPKKPSSKRPAKKVAKKVVKKTAKKVAKNRVKKK